ncbi:Arp2/3 complex, 34 kd subunit p34-Arc-domain-containing protein, partial [Baffinella frigidus]
GLHTSPVVTLHRSPPRELDGEDLGKAGDDTVYISFVLFQRHFAQAGDDTVYISFVLFQRHFAQREKAEASITAREKAEASITAVCQFRTYLHYHIKASKSLMHMRMRSRAEDLIGASKSFMHMRMRSRAEDLLGVLNRSKPAPEAIADKKTWVLGVLNRAKPAPEAIADKKTWTIIGP